MKTDYYLIWFYGVISLDIHEEIEFKKQIEDILYKVFNNIVYTYFHHYNRNLEVYVLTCNNDFNLLNLNTIISDTALSDTALSDKIIHWINTSHKKVKFFGKTNYRSKL